MLRYKIIKKNCKKKSEQWKGATCPIYIIIIYNNHGRIIFEETCTHLRYKSRIDNHTKKVRKHSNYRKQMYCLLSKEKTGEEDRMEELKFQKQLIY